MDFSVSKIASSCNKQLLKNEKSILAVKASKLKKNHMEAKKEAIEVKMCSSVDKSLVRDKKRQTALNRRKNSK